MILPQTVAQATTSHVQNFVAIAKFGWGQKNISSYLNYFIKCTYMWGYEYTHTMIV